MIEDDVDPMEGCPNTKDYVTQAMSRTPEEEDEHLPPDDEEEEKDEKSEEAEPTGPPAPEDKPDA